MSKPAAVIDGEVDDPKAGKAVATKRKTDVVAAPQSESTSVLSMLQTILTNPTFPMERVNQAFDFYQRVQTDAARKAYYEAKVSFKASVPDVTKDKQNKQYDSAYASIGNVVNTVNEALSKFDLDASWEFDQGERIKVTCTLRHALGHSESVSLFGAPDASGSKNPLQQIKSTLTYLKLATYEAVTGIATKEGNLDDDGNAAGGKSDEFITEAQADALRADLDALSADIAGYCQHIGVDAITKIPVAKYARALEAVNAKRRKIGK